jgi:hypothetical protein
MIPQVFNNVFHDTIEHWIRINQKYLLGISK